VTRRLADFAVRSGKLDFEFVVSACRPGTEGTPSCNYGRWPRRRDHLDQRKFGGAFCLRTNTMPAYAEAVVQVSQGWLI